MILVTGAAGFIGRHLTRSFLAEGLDVVGVDNFITSDRADLEPLLSERRFRFVEMDVTCTEFLRLGAEVAPSAIYHLACPTGVPNLGRLALEMLEASYEGSRAVLEIARSARSSVLLTSSAEVYGNPLVSPQTENYTGNVDPLGPRKGYEEGKRVAETLFGIYAERYGLDAKVVRVFNTYGPGMRLTDTRVIPSFVAAALTGKPLVLHGDGSQVRCHTHVTDMVAGLLAAMRCATPGRAYNLGSGRQTTVRELAELVVRLAASASRLESTSRPLHDHDARLPDTSRARNELGWDPRISLEEGLRSTIDDFAARLSRGGA